jgi:hypothetical protein
MSDFFSGLKIENWWHAVTIVGGCGVVASSAIPVGDLPRQDVLLFFFGILLFGIGQWINHPIQQRIIPQGIITGYYRNPSKLGVFFEIVGSLLIIAQCVRFYLLPQ